MWNNHCADSASVNLRCISFVGARDSAWKDSDGGCGMLGLLFLLSYINHPRDECNVQWTIDYTRARDRRMPSFVSTSMPSVLAHILDCFGCQVNGRCPEVGKVLFRKPVVRMRWNSRFQNCCGSKCRVGEFKTQNIMINIKEHEKRNRKRSNNVKSRIRKKRSEYKILSHTYKVGEYVDSVRRIYRNVFLQP